MCRDQAQIESATQVIRKLILTLAGGFCGAITRYALSKPLLLLAATLPGGHTGFPYDILFINLTGAFAIGLLFGAFEQGAGISPDLRLALGTGFLGAYTTFSSFMVGASMLTLRGAGMQALLYLVGSMTAGVALASAGFATAGAAIHGRQRVRLWFSESEEELVDGGWDEQGALGDLNVPGTSSKLNQDAEMDDLEARR